MTRVLVGHFRCTGQALVERVPSLVFASSPTRPFHSTSHNSLKNYYDILGVPRNATSQEIKSAYYDKARMLHPDAAKTYNDASEIKFQEVSEAYEVLGDTDKRRVYDSSTRPTSYGVYGPRSVRENMSRTPRRTPAEPVTMNHIQHVYKTLNRVDVQEAPKFRPFEDHNYPGTAFNRFEYSRIWHPQKRVFIYVKKSTAGQYQREMAEKHRILQICLLVVTGGVGAFFFNRRFVKWDTPIPPPGLTKEEKIEYISEGRQIPR